MLKHNAHGEGLCAHKKNQREDKKNEETNEKKNKNTFGRGNSNNKSLQVNEVGCVFDWLNYAHRDRNVNTCSFFFELHFLFDNFFFFVLLSVHHQSLCHVVLILSLQPQSLLRAQSDKPNESIERV